MYVNTDGTFRLRDMPTGVSTAGAQPGTGFIDGIGTVRACLDCGVLVAGGQTRCMKCAQKVGPKFTVEYDPADGAPIRDKLAIRYLPPGSIFETDDGVQAVKSEYKLRPNEPGGPAMSIIIGSGEFFCNDQGDDEIVTWIE
jgi:hypothetical protein